MEHIISAIKKKQKFKRIIMVVVAQFISALVFNLLLLPLNIVTGGTGGIATITKHLYHLDPSMMILILQAACLIISFMYLGLEKTAGAALASFSYPICVSLTAPIAKLITIDTSDVLILVIFAGVVSGIANGMVYKTGYNGGGLGIINQIMFEKFNIAISKTSLIVNGIVIVLGGYFFGSLNAMYAIILLYISNLVLDKVLLGISNNKAFYIITSKEEQVSDYIINKLHHNVTIFDVKGGFLEKKRKVLLSVIPTREYFKVTEGIKLIDKDVFFVATDSYEVIGGK